MLIIKQNLSLNSIIVNIWGEKNQNFQNKHLLEVFSAQFSYYLLVNVLIPVSYISVHKSYIAKIFDYYWRNIKSSTIESKFIYFCEVKVLAFVDYLMLLTKDQRNLIISMIISNSHVPPPVTTEIIILNHCVDIKFVSKTKGACLVLVLVLYILSYYLKQFDKINLLVHYQCVFHILRVHSNLYCLFPNSMT